MSAKIYDIEKERTKRIEQNINLEGDSLWGTSVIERYEVIQKEVNNLYLDFLEEQARTRG